MLKCFTTLHIQVSVEIKMTGSALNSINALGVRFSFYPREWGNTCSPLSHFAPYFRPYTMCALPTYLHMSRKIVWHTGYVLPTVHTFSPTVQMWLGLWYRTGKRGRFKSDACLVCHLLLLLFRWEIQ